MRNVQLSDDNHVTVIINLENLLYAKASWISKNHYELDVGVTKEKEFVELNLFYEYDGRLNEALKTLLGE